ncbi:MULTISPECIES: MauE/DoxX family redox-associated membrane protein [unclassified Bradyrhizobium]|uniref:MauE/DoxX family redox-associated membrane protein n=1 Tax=unclassified Bradyrhizobium TaxID=2631580 RepID=UPI001BA633D0|nr:MULTISPECIES: MauE/DoxX family redox-associated membrane protein [unclassified Bradyrhizobium]MBR1201834.1 hypothetical protein [Bradyrhizobium sp. AUGA SZCCT0124]MBR1311597.1 hypothetical protein [Bradyrhizobium sp. AUGA SZCCT0051]MBR1338783.1 hypothetical protein [Bradyrhizobium sp. AUGA SZCCT0105]MBR1353357.1 hypothetical protein [Bradyrhizobium sp. AUGA SZCCT0045]
MVWQNDPLLRVLASGSILVVLARAVVEKVFAYSRFVSNVRDYRLLPAASAPFAAAALMAAEMAAMSCLLVSPYAAGGALLSILLFAGCAVAMAAALVAGRAEIDCACGGNGQVVSWPLVVRNIVLVVIAGSILLPTDSSALSRPKILLGLAALLAAYLLLAIAERAMERWGAIR